MAGPKYLQCPYCAPVRSKSGKRMPNTVGKYRVMEMNDVMLMLRCEKCRKVMKVKYFGYILTEADITPLDIEQFERFTKNERENERRKKKGKGRK